MLGSNLGTVILRPKLLPNTPSSPLSMSCIIIWKECCTSRDQSTSLTEHPEHPGAPCCLAHHREARTRACNGMGGKRKHIVALLLALLLLWAASRQHRLVQVGYKRPPSTDLSSQSSRGTSHFSCQGMEECFEAHMNNQGLAVALRDRCSMGNRTNLHALNLTFTHIPKCGGSSLRYLLHKHFKSRFQRMEPNMGPHLPFFLSQKLHPQNIFFTMLREPTSLAISLYNYINMHKNMPVHLMHDKFWLNSYRRDPVEWSKDEFIQGALRNQVLRFFTWYSNTAKNGLMRKRGTESGAEFTNPRVWREFLSLPETYRRVLDPWVPSWTQEQEEGITNYTLTMPLQYRCSNELYVTSILIQRYSAVGIMEDYQSFLHVLHHRAKLDDNSFSSLIVDSSDKKNPSISKISETKLQIVKNNLHDIFFCSRVLWKYAALINQRDSQCYVK